MGQDAKKQRTVPDGDVPKQSADLEKCSESFLFKDKDKSACGADILTSDLQLSF